eukprot:9470579-Pyramimonas_sp.AAC.2
MHSTPQEGYLGRIGRRVWCVFRRIDLRCRRSRRRAHRAPKRSGGPHLAPSGRAGASSAACLAAGRARSRAGGPPPSPSRGRVGTSSSPSDAR